MSGPRLQSNLIEGMENCGGTAYAYNGVFASNASGQPRATGQTYTDSRPWSNFYTLLDLQDGRQAFRNLTFIGGGNGWYTSVRYALKTNTPNKYVVISVVGAGETAMGGDVIFAERFEVGDGAYDYSKAETLTITLPNAQWKNARGGDVAAASTNGGGAPISMNIYNPEQIDEYAGKGASGTGTMTLANSGGNITWTFNFGANVNIMYCSASKTKFIPFPVDLGSKKYGAQGDHLVPRTQTYDFVAKVWSPMKGCYCLKNLADGEIPIFNE